MTKKLLVLMVAILFIIACGKKDSTKTTETKTEKEVVKTADKVVKEVKEVKKAAALTIGEFKTKAKDLIEKEITVTGTVVHVCKENGKKLFLGGVDPKNKVKITAGKSVPKFEVTLEGDTMQVTGIVKELRVDEAYIDLQVKKVNDAPEEKKDEKVEEKKEHHDNAPKADDHHKSTKEDQLKSLENFRAKVKASKEGYLAFYSIEYVSSKTVKNTEKVVKEELEKVKENVEKTTEKIEKKMEEVEKVKEVKEVKEEKK